MIESFDKLVRQLQKLYQGGLVCVFEGKVSIRVLHSTVFFDAYCLLDALNEIKCKLWC